MSMTSVINWRLSDAEREGLDKLTIEVGVKRSRLLRRLVREAIRGGPDYFADGVKELRAAHRELSAVGRNLNQIAARLNEERQARQAGELPSKTKMDEAILVNELALTQAKLSNLKRIFAQEIEAAHSRTTKAIELDP